ncbi:MAG: phage Gp37/Gp68 family protein [Balneolales bacterium]|nr:phage Gp37/Gp68 family protein [Balneolales bacterium]
MAGKSKIEWTEATWNPTTGCSKVSAGCKNCYAENWAHMQQKRGITQYEKGFQFSLATSRSKDPLRWKESKLVFVNSMSDLFHEQIPLNYLIELFETMEQSARHTYQILTKRPENALKWLKHYNWPVNVWLGVSVESKKTSHRLDTLRKIPAKTRFVSFEPLLEDVVPLDLSELDWIIVGGESGGQARHIEKRWVTRIQDQCKEQNIPFFFKQWGKRAFNPNNNDPTLNKSHEHHARGGCLIDNKLIREFPKAMYGTSY